MYQCNATLWRCQSSEEANIAFYCTNQRVLVPSVERKMTFPNLYSQKNKIKSKMLQREEFCFISVIFSMRSSLTSRRRYFCAIFDGGSLSPRNGIVAGARNIWHAKVLRGAFMSTWYRVVELPRQDSQVSSIQMCFHYFMLTEGGRDRGRARTLERKIIVD